MHSWKSKAKRKREPFLPHVTQEQRDRSLGFVCSECLICYKYLNGALHYASPLPASPDGLGSPRPHGFFYGCGADLMTSLIYLAPLCLSHCFLVLKCFLVLRCLFCPRLTEKECCFVLLCFASLVFVCSEPGPPSAALAGPRVMGPYSCLLIAMVRAGGERRALYLVLTQPLGTLRTLTCTLHPLWEARFASSQPNRRFLRCRAAS